MSGTIKRLIVIFLGLAVLGVFARAVIDRLSSDAGSEQRRGATGPVPVELAAVEHGPIEWRRVFSGTLESPAEFVVAPKVGGRIEKLAVDLSDPVSRGQVVAELDNDEYLQAVSQKEADLAVSEANRAEAVSALEIARRELSRMETLQQRGVASETQFDVAKANALAKEAAVKVAEAQVVRAEAELQTARIRLGYTTVIAAWSGGRGERYVAERFVDEGDTVTANTPLLSIVELHPMLAVVYASEKDYAQLHPGQPVTLSTDAYPGETFEGTVSRVAPVFRETSRQARVELTVNNQDQRLKPGMFVRVQAVLARAEDATIVPVEAITRRQGREVLFVVDASGNTVSLQPVATGIRSEGRIQVTGDGIEGRVVTLGHQLLDDGSRVTVPAATPKPESPGEAEAG
jgi:RND family efflux transporter MFP subunit